MRPYLLKGHERPLTQVKYNREGDLLISCAKDLQPCLWYADDGKRIGTFEGHKGDSSRLITASADSTVRVWNVQTGQELYQYEGKQPCRAVDLCVGDDLIAFTSDDFMGTPPYIQIHKLEGDEHNSSLEHVHSIETPKGRITRCYWTDQNQTLITAHDSGIVRRWDVETGKCVADAQVHAGPIQDMQIHPDGVQAITASLDKTAKLIDVDSLQVIKTYQTGNNVQSAALSPIFDHVVLGGGQDAAQVTTTAFKAGGGFESRFFHKVFGEEFGNVRGHFGPLNTIAFHPSGRSFTTGGEDGYVRIHHFDIDYFTTKFF